MFCDEPLTAMLALRFDELTTIIFDTGELLPHSGPRFHLALCLLSLSLLQFRPRKNEQDQAKEYSANTVFAKHHRSLNIIIYRKQLEYQERNDDDAPTKQIN